MHKGPKCIQSFSDHPKKIPFVQKHKEGAICAILREKSLILGHSKRLKKVLLNAQGCARLRTGPIIMQIPRGYQKKSLLCRKSAILSIRWEFQFWEGWGGFLKKVLVLVQRPQHKSTPVPVAAPKNNPFGTILIEFGDTKKCYTFWGLELAPKSRKKPNRRSQLHAQRSQMHSIPLGQSEKNSFSAKAQGRALAQ